MGCTQYLTSILTILSLSNGQLLSFDRDSKGILFCSGANFQQVLDIDKVVGTWFAKEVIYHKEDKKQTPGRNTVDSCPIIQLYRQENTRMIRLVWKEDAGVVEYNFLIPDPKMPGFWMSSGGQNGSLLQAGSYRYKHFAGTVEVAKAVGTHIVLTFCSPGQDLYSVLLTREKKMPKSQMYSVNKMLETRGLLPYSIKEACRDSATSLTASALFVVSLLLYFR